MNEYYKEDKTPFLWCIIILGVVCCIAWFCHDIGRNKPIYESTDSTMAELDKRMQNIEGRLDSMQTRLDENQKAVSRIAEGIGRSREKAEIVAGGIDQAEGRLDDAIKRSERIEDLIRDIEKANR